MNLNKIPLHQFWGDKVTFMPPLDVIMSKFLSPAQLDYARRLDLPCMILLPYKSSTPSWEKCHYKMVHDIYQNSAYTFTCTLVLKGGSHSQVTFKLEKLFRNRKAVLLYKAGEAYSFYALPDATSTGDWVQTGINPYDLTWNGL